ncbi:hypothetical protein D3C80_2055390 [compost metagenome]
MIALYQHLRRRSTGPISDGNGHMGEGFETKTVLVKSRLKEQASKYGRGFHWAGLLQSIHEKFATLHH